MDANVIDVDVFYVHKISLTISIINIYLCVL